MSSYLPTTRFTRGKLPHWEVRNGRYFVTVRCADSLPRETVERLREIHLNRTASESTSEEFSKLQRHYFSTLEKYIDTGIGDCLLQQVSAAEHLVAEFHAAAEWQVDVPHYSVMPNHWHAMIEPRGSSTRSLAEIIRRVKGRSARHINRALGRVGALWQREWFDRWMRTDDEYDRCVRYIQNNPIKAGLLTGASWRQ